MSQENVELLRRAIDAFNRRDLEAFLALCDPDLEFISYLMQVDGGEPYHGRACSVLPRGVEERYTTRLLSRGNPLVSRNFS